MANQNSTGYYWEKIIQRLSLESLSFELIHPKYETDNKSLKPNVRLTKKIIKQIRISMVFALHVFKKTDSNSLVFSGTNPIIFLFVMPILKMHKNFKWILLCHDVFPDNFAILKKINKETIFYRLICRYFDWVYSSADKIICVGRDMKTVISNKIGCSNQVYYVSNWVNEFDVKPIPRNQVDFFISAGLTQKIVFQFFGNIGPLQNIDNLLRAIALVKSKNAAFVFIGGGLCVKKLLEFISEHQDLDIRYLEVLPMAQNSMGLAMCDVALVGLQKGMIGLGVPSKAYFSMAADKPILGFVESKSEIGLIIAEHQIGWQCEPDAPDELAEKIDYICSNPQEIMKMSPRKLFEESYTGVKSLSKISEIIKTQLKEMDVKIS